MPTNYREAKSAEYVARKNRRSVYEYFDAVRQAEGSIKDAAQLLEVSESCVSHMLRYHKDRVPEDVRLLLTTRKSKAGRPFRPQPKRWRKAATAPRPQAVSNILVPLDVWATRQGITLNNARQLRFKRRIVGAILAHGEGLVPHGALLVPYNAPELPPGETYTPTRGDYCSLRVWAERHGMSHSAASWLAKVGRVRVVTMPGGRQYLPSETPPPSDRLRERAEIKGGRQTKSDIITLLAVKGRTSTEIKRITGFNDDFVFPVLNRLRRLGRLEPHAGRTRPALNTAV